MAAHPLQRLASPGRSVSALVHIVGIASFSASFHYLRLFPTELSDSFGGNFQFLTIIGLGISLVTFVLGLLSDLTLSPALFRAKNTLSVCSAPLEVLITTLYWSIALVNKELLMPPEYQLPFIPDFGFHAMPAIMLTLDLLLLSPPYAIRGYSAMALSMTLAFVYWGWVEYCFSKNGWYPYPLFALLSTWQRALLFTFSASLMTGSTLLLKLVYGKLNGIEEFKKDAARPLKPLKAH